MASMHGERRTRRSPSSTSFDRSRIRARSGYVRRENPANAYHEVVLNTTKPISMINSNENPSLTRSRILTPEGAAEFLSLDPRTVTRWARKGYLPAHPLGEGKRKFWRFYQDELDAWLAARTNQWEAA